MSGKKRVVVLDTNVLYAGLYSTRGASFMLLQALVEGRLHIALSTALLFEYEDVLKRHQAVLDLSNRAIEQILDNLCALSDHQKIYFLWRPQLQDLKDDLVLELAVAAGARSIVTHNINDFRGSERFGVKAITPKQVLEEIS